ncbi:hypothetical protein [Celeribacter baekdonensis]|uniref:Beta-barrel assembly machine subunit BamF n=1 Tax=Celeribacter baekdonensis TaxID=875171 RepID=A0A2R4M4A0_9RHOB|nr:hypothetical protein [Celeribacter baekdonensis]AVW92011.1 hypothetical protein DA792_13765 [Celeribacter baekdonensis]
MRTRRPLLAHMLVASVALSACQLQTPVDPPISNTDVPAAGYSQAQLSRAFAAAAEAAESEDATEVAEKSGQSSGQSKGLFAFLKPVPPEVSPLSGTEIEVVAGTSPEQSATLIAMPEVADLAVDEAQGDPVDEVKTGGLFAFLKPKPPLRRRKPNLLLRGQKHLVSPLCFRHQTRPQMPPSRLRPKRPKPLLRRTSRCLGF